MDRLKQVPEFQDEVAEMLFWQEHDSSDYLDWKQAKTVAIERFKASPEELFDDSCD